LHSLRQCLAPLRVATPRPADLAAVARKHGLDWEWFGKRWPYRCERCGSRDVGMQLLPDVRPSSSPDRQADLAAAKALVAEIEEEERRRGRRATKTSASATLPFRSIRSQEARNGLHGSLSAFVGGHPRRGESRQAG
jgi:hypothetical protein